MNFLKRQAENNIEMFDVNQGNKKIKPIDCLNLSSSGFQLGNENCVFSSDFNCLPLTASSSTTVSSPSRSTKASPKKKTLKKKQEAIVPPTILNISTNCKDDVFISKMLKNIEAFQIYQHCEGIFDEQHTQDIYGNLAALGEDYSDDGTESPQRETANKKNKKKPTKSSKKGPNKAMMSALKYFL